MFRFRFRPLFLICFLLTPSLMAQGMSGGTSMMTREDQLALVAPTASGETGLFTVVTADTLRRGDWSFGAACAAVVRPAAGGVAGCSRRAHPERAGPPGRRSLRDLLGDAAGHLGSSGRVASLAAAGNGQPHFAIRER